LFPRIAEYADGNTARPQSAVPDVDDDLRLIAIPVADGDSDDRHVGRLVAHRLAGNSRYICNVQRVWIVHERT
jgi:hypothetical protein